MAINTSNNKVRIISTTVSGLATNSKFSDITSPALVVNTSDGGVFYADGSGGTSLKQVAALPSHTHSGYATTASLANYLPLVGGTMTGIITTKSSTASWSSSKTTGHIVAGHTPGEGFAPIISTGLQSGGYGKLGQVTDEFGLYAYSSEGTTPSLRIVLKPESSAVSIYGHTVPYTTSTYSLGSSTNRWNTLYSTAANISGTTTTAGLSTSGAITLTGTDSGDKSTIAFTRTTYNYIKSPSGSNIGIQPGGLSSSSTTGYKFDAAAFYPGATNTYTLGKSDKVWKNIYATTITGNLTGNADTANTANYADATRDPDYHAYANRRTSANVNFGADGGLHYFLATASITDSTASEGHIIHCEWDNAAGKYLAQLHISHGTTGLKRRYTGSTADSWSPWITIIDSSNYSSYCASVGHTHETLTSANSIIINRTSTSNYPVISYQSNGTLVGVLGFDTDGKLIVSPNRSNNTSYYDVIHSGNISSQSVAAATNASNIYINNSANSGAFPLTFVSNTTKGSQALFVSTGKSLTFNPSTGNLAATTFTGSLSGNATTATTATKVTVGTGTGSSYRAIVVTNGENGLYSAGTDTGKPRYNYSTGDVKAASFTTDGGNFIGNLTGTASGNLPLSGGTLTGKLNMNGTAYPQIFGNGTYLAFGYNSSSSQVVIDSACLRRGSSATVALGSSTYPWSNFYASAATLTGALTISGSGASTAAIDFTRASYNYISAPANGSIVISPGVEKNANNGYKFDASAFSPNANVTYDLGTSTKNFNTTYTRYIDTASAYVLRIKAGGSECITVSTKNRVYIGGSTIASTYTLEVGGSAYASNFITSSDKRLKTNIKEISNSEKSLELPFYEFNYKSDNRHSYGHMAQDVEELYPDVVMHDNSDESYLSLDYTTLHSIQIKALIDEINKLKEEIRSLKASNVKFK